MTYSLTYLTQFLKQLEQHHKKEGADLGKLLDHNYEKLDNIPLIHHILDSYLASQNKQDKARLLLLLDYIFTKGADPNVINSDGDTLFYRAIKEKQSSFVDILKHTKKIEYNQGNDKNGKTLLDVCLEKWSENIQLMQFISQQNNDELQTKFLNYISDYQDYTGIKKSKNASEKKIRFLIEKKLIDFNKPNSDSLLPLHLLCLIGNIDLINLVLNSLKQVGIEIDFDKQDSSGNSALHLACHPGNQPNEKIIEWLLKNGANPNAFNKTAASVAHIAIENNRVDLIQLLLHYKANFTSLDSLCRTPLSKMLTLPELTSNIHILQLLMQQQFLIFSSANIDPIKLAYEKGFWIRQVAAYCRTKDKAIKRETEILTKREKLNSEELFQHSPQHDINKNPEYYYSPATFVKAGIPIRLFNSGKGFGVIIQTDNSIPAWCSGLKGQIMTDFGNDVDFEAKELKFTYHKEHQCQNKNSNEIVLQLLRLFKQYVIRGYSPLEKYQAITNPSGLPYNEGLFRYKKSEIMAFYIAQTAEDAYYGLELRKALELGHLPFYSYSSNGSIEQSKEESVKKLAENYQPEINNKQAAINNLLPPQQQSKNITKNQNAAINSNRMFSQPVQPNVKKAESSTPISYSGSRRYKKKL